MRALGVNPGAITPAAAHSHPDCRGIPILIVVLHFWEGNHLPAIGPNFFRSRRPTLNVWRDSTSDPESPKVFEYGISQSGGPIESGEENGRQKTSLIGAFSCSFPVALAFLRGANLIHD